MTVRSAITLEWIAANLKRGTVNFVNATEVNVVFAAPFAQVPKVVLTPSDVGGSNKNWYVSNKSVNGFTAGTGVATTGSFDWMAMSP